MRIVVTLVDGELPARDFLIDADPQTALHRVFGVLTPVGTMTVDGRPVDSGDSLAQAGLRHGSVVRLTDDPGAIAAQRRGLVDVAIASGPRAGHVVSIGPGSHWLGNDPMCDVVLDGLPETALVVRVGSHGGVSVRLAATGVSATLAGEALTENPVNWNPRDQLLIGSLLLQVRPATQTPAHLDEMRDEGYRDFNRPPRIVRGASEPLFRIPVAPTLPMRNAWPWLTAFLPLIAGIVMVSVFHSWMFLSFAILSPIMAFANVQMSRRQGVQTYRQKKAEHARTLERVEADITARREVEREQRLEAAPSAATCWATAVGPEAGLWQRRPRDVDHLLLRLGTAGQLSSVVVEDMREPVDHRRRVPAVLPDLPVTVPLQEAGVVGIVGPANRRSARWVVAQLGVTQSPRDVQIVVLGGTEKADEWAWSRWLPHLAPAMGQDARVMVGNDTETIGRRVGELSRLINTRTVQAEDDRKARFTPDVVVILDGARRLRNYPGVASVLREGPAVGVYSVCLEETERLLPRECTSVLVAGSEGEGVLHRTEHEMPLRLRLDHPDDDWFEPMARALAPIRDTGDEEDDAALPRAARLTEVLQMEPMTVERMNARWAAGQAEPVATVGVSMDGLMSINLVSDGPHGLIAGTTGSGKSELLQSMVASLAVANRPDDINFVLVDYKGGAAFKDAVHLPHTVGMVTDLDAHLVERALTSLTAELTRREHLLADADAKDIEDYLDARRRNPGLTAMPRLVLVIDEFASMVRELPDFVTGLVNLAQRGRSLGIHLILATQRPSGVVSGEIRANTNLRISLRVTDTGDSTDVIDTPEAAHIPASVPGRAYVRLGHNAIVPFQTARVGGRAPGVGSVRPVEPLVTPAPWATAGAPAPAPPRTDVADDEVTDLSRLVETARRAADELRLAPNHSPWLPPLGETIVLDDVAVRGLGSGGLARVAWALGDLPASQSQAPVDIDLDELGHLFVVGSPRSGRSQALRTIVGSLAREVSAADLHLFGIDMGNGALLPMTRLPHTGAVVQRSDRERLVRLLDRLEAELSRRQELLGRLGVADVREQRQAAADAESRLPHLVVILDRWESFVSTYGEIDAGVYVERVYALLREGAGAGLHLILAGDRSLLSGRISVLTEDKWIMRLADRNDYSLAGVHPRQVASTMPEGRMVRSVTGQEAQVALLAADPSTVAQTAALDEIARMAWERDRGLPPALSPMRVDSLPSTLEWGDVERYRSPGARTPLTAFVGIGGDELAPVEADLRTGAPSFLVAGPARSGRSTLLAAMTHTFLESGTEVVIITPRRSPLTSLFAGRAGVRAVFEGAELTQEQLEPVLEAPGPVVLVIDDAERTRDIPAKEYLRAWARGAAENGRATVVAGNAAEISGGFGNWLTDIRNNQRGALLSPREIFDGDLIGLRLPRSLTRAPISPGRAIVNLGDGVSRIVQIPNLPADPDQTPGTTSPASQMEKSWLSAQI